MGDLPHVEETPDKATTPSEEKSLPVLNEPEPPKEKKRLRFPFKRKTNSSDALSKGKGKAPPGPKPVKFRQLFRFATPTELALNVIGLLLAVCAGAATPLMTLMFGNMARSLVDFGVARKSGLPDDEIRAAGAALVDAASKQALYLMGIGLGMFVATYGFMFIWTYTSEQQSMRIREAYLAGVLRQEVSGIAPHR